MDEIALGSRENAFVTAQKLRKGPTRRCKWCRKVLRGKRPDAKYCSDACKMAAHRARRDPENAPVRPPVRHRASGPQVSYFKMLRRLTEHFEGEGMHRPYAHAKAQGILLPLLPERQRARVEAMDGHEQS